MGERVRYEREEEGNGNFTVLLHRPPLQRKFTFLARKGKRKEGRNESFLLTSDCRERRKNPRRPRIPLSPILIPQASMGGYLSASGPNHASAMFVCGYLVLVSAACHPFNDHERALRASNAHDDIRVRPTSRLRLRHDLVCIRGSGPCKSASLARSAYILFWA